MNITHSGNIVLLSAKEVAKRFAVHPATVRARREPFEKLDRILVGAKRVCYRADQVEELMERLLAKAEEPVSIEDHLKRIEMNARRRIIK